MKRLLELNCHFYINTFHHNISFLKDEEYWEFGFPLVNLTHYRLSHFLALITSTLSSGSYLHSTYNDSSEMHIYFHNMSNTVVPYKGLLQENKQKKNTNEGHSGQC